MKLDTFHALRENDASGPGMGSWTVVPDDDANFTDADDNPIVARQLVVFADGTVHFLGADNVEDTWTFTSGMAFPQRIEVAVKRVYEDSTVAAGNIKAIW